MSPSDMKPVFETSAAFVRRRAFAAIIVLLATTPAVAAEPEPLAHDREGAGIQIKDFISDLESLHMSSDPEGLELPKSVDPVPEVKEATKATPAAPAKVTAKAASSEPSQSAKQKDASTLSRRNSTKSASTAKAASFPPAKVGKEVSTKKSEAGSRVATTAKPESEQSKSTPTKPTTVAASASRKKLEPISETSSKLPSGTKLRRGELTVSLAEGGVAVVRPRGDRSGPGISSGPVGSRYPAANVSRSNYTVEGRVAGISPRPDGRLRVLVVTPSQETVQVVVSGEYAGQSLYPGEIVRLRGERIGGSERHPVMEINAMPAMTAPVTFDPFMPPTGMPRSFSSPFPDMMGSPVHMMPGPPLPMW